MIAHLAASSRCAAASRTALTLKPTLKVALARRPQPVCAGPDGYANAASVHSDLMEEEEEAWYDSDFESPMFIPECPTPLLAGGHNHCLHPVCFSLFEQETQGREELYMSRMTLEGVIFPEAPSMPFKHKQ